MKSGGDSLATKIENFGYAVDVECGDGAGYAPLGGCAVEEDGFGGAAQEIC